MQFLQKNGLKKNVNNILNAYYCIESLENKIMFGIKIGNINDNQLTQNLASIRVQRIF